METCDDCHKEFQTQKGLLTHRGMMHKAGVGGKPLPKKPVSLPAPDLRQVIESGKIAEVAEALGRAYGQFEGGIVRGMSEGLHSSKRSKKGSSEKVDNRD